MSDHGISRFRGLVASLTYRGMTARMEVGADGLRIVDGFTKRFVPWADVHGGDVQGPRVRVHLRSGEVLYLVPVGDDPLGEIESLRPNDAAMNLTALVDAMGSAWRVAGNAQSHEVPEGTLAREGRSVPEWMSALRAASRPQGAGYRSAGLMPETLAAVVEDGQRPIEQRVAAGAALGLGGTDQHARLQALAAVTAEPRVRVVLEAAATGDEATLTEALATATSKRAVG